MPTAALRAATPEGAFRDWCREPDDADRAEYWARLACVLLNRIASSPWFTSEPPALPEAAFDPWGHKPEPTPEESAGEADAQEQMLLAFMRR